MLLTKTAMLLGAGVRKYYDAYAGLPREAWYGICVYLLNSIQSSMIFFISVYLVHTLHFSIVEAGYMLSLYALGTMLGGFLGGKWADRYSPRKLTSVAALLRGFAYCILVLLKTPWQVAFLVFSIGVCSYIFVTANSLDVLSCCEKPEERVKALSLLSAAANLGMSVAGILVGFLANTGFKVIFATIGVFSVTINLIRVLQKKKQRNAQHTVAVFSKEGPTTKPAYGTWRFVIVLGVVFLVNLIYAQCSSTYPIYVTQQFNAHILTLLFTFNGLFIVFFSVPLNDYFKQKNKMLMLGVGSFLFGLGMFMLCVLPQSIAWLIFAWGICTVGEIIFLTMGQEVCYQLSSEGKKGQGLGFFRGLTAGSRMVGPVIGSFVYLHWGALFLWLLCGGIGLIGLFIGVSCKKYTS